MIKTIDLSSGNWATERYVLPNGDVVVSDCGAGRMCGDWLSEQYELGLSELRTRQECGPTFAAMSDADLIAAFAGAAK